MSLLLKMHEGVNILVNSCFSEEDRIGVRERVETPVADGDLETPSDYSYLRSSLTFTFRRELSGVAKDVFVTANCVAECCFMPKTIIPPRVEISKRLSCCVRGAHHNYGD